MKLVKKINVELNRKGFPKEIDVVQYDTGLQLKCIVKDFDIPDGTIATLYAEKPSGKFVYQQTGIEISDNTIIVDLENQAITEHGKVWMQITLKNGTDTISTFEMLIKVQKSRKDSGAVESTTVIRAFDEAIEKAVAQINEARDAASKYISESVDQSLSIAGKAADAAAVGKKVTELNEKIGQETNKLSDEITNKLDRYKMPVNRLSAEGEQAGYALNKATGGIYAMDGYRVSDYCDVGTDNPHGTITIRGLTGAARCCFYDSEKAYISTIEGAVVQTDFITLPDNAKYVRVQSTSEFATAFVNIGVDDEYHDPTERTEVVVPKKMSDLINDEQYFSEKVDGAIKAKHVDFTLESANLLDESQIAQGYFVWHHNGNIEANASYYVSDYVDISGNAGSLVIVKYAEETSEVPDGTFHRCAFYDADKVYISGITNGTTTSTDLATGVISVPENAKYIRVSWIKSSKYPLIAYGNSTNIPYVPYGKKDANPESLYNDIQHNKKVIEEIKSGVSKWSEKTWFSYGDSITAQGNNGGGYQSIVDDMLKFAKSYRRGVGGQTYKANSSTFYANPDGSYAGRYGMGGLTEAPEGTTTHLGYFASWDRITTMIPENIRESINLVVLCGGTNDHGSVEDVETDGVISAGTPVWISGSNVDNEWATSSFYVGGDYDITSFAGAIASTITKMRIWCPNAVVVLATPYPRWNTETMGQYTNSKGLDFREMCEIQIATAKYMGCPVVDANAMCCIGGVNFAETVSDGVHPNTVGLKLYAKALADGLNNISPKII